MGEAFDYAVYTIVREALSECNSNGHLGLEERMALSDQIAEAATNAIAALVRERQLALTS